MSNRDLIRLVLANLNRMRARVALTTIGVLIGTIAVILLISLAIGLQKSIETDLIDSFGDLTTIQVFSGGNPFGGPEADSDEPVEPLTRTRLRDLAAIEHVNAVTPEIGLRGPASLKFGRLETFGNINGVDADAVEHLDWELASGRARIGRGQIVLGPKVFEDADDGRRTVRTANGGNVVVETGARESSGRTTLNMQDRSITLALTRFNEEGDEVTRNERLRVAGVFEESDGQNDWSIYMSTDDVEEYNAWFSSERRERDPEYGNVLVLVDDRENVEAVQEEIDALGYSFFSAGEILKGIRQFFAIAQLVLGGVGSVAIVVAAIGIMNTMTMAIYERTREIGIMKAVGATNRDVLKIFLAEAGLDRLSWGRDRCGDGLGDRLWRRLLHPRAALRRRQSGAGQYVPPGRHPLVAHRVLDRLLDARRPAQRRIPSPPRGQHEAAAGAADGVGRDWAALSEWDWRGWSGAR